MDPPRSGATPATSPGHPPHAPRPHACPDLIRRLLPSAAVPSRGLCSGGPSPDSPKTPALRDVCDRAVCRWPLSPLPALSLLCSFETPAATLCAHRPRAPPTPAHLRRDHRLQAPGRLPPWVALQPGTQRALSSEWMSNSYFQTEAYVLFPVPKAIGGGRASWSPEAQSRPRRSEGCLLEQPGHQCNTRDAPEAQRLQGPRRGASRGSRGSEEASWRGRPWRVSGRLPVRAEGATHRRDQRGHTRACWERGRVAGGSQAPTALLKTETSLA